MRAIHKSRPRRVCAFIALLIAALPCGCGDGDESLVPVASATPLEMHAKRELAAAYYEEDRLSEAREVLAWILAQPSAVAQDYVNAACVEMAVVNVDRPETRRFLESARALDKDLPALLYCDGMLDTFAGDYEASVEKFRLAMVGAPNDIPNRYQYGAVCADLDRVEEAERVLLGILDEGIERIGSFYLPAEYRLSSIYMRSRDKDVQARGRALRALFDQHKAEGWPEPVGVLLYRGNLGRVQAPDVLPDDGEVTTGPTPLSFERVDAALLTEAGRVAFARVADVDQDRRPDLLAIGEHGAFLARQEVGGLFEETRLAEGSWQKVISADLSNLGNHSVLLIAADGSIRFLAPDRSLRYTARDLAVPNARQVRDAVFVDYDHEGDIDLLLATDQGLVLLRNDGLKVEPSEETAEEVVFTDATVGSGLPDVAVDWVTIEDFDADRDIDFLCGSTAAQGAPAWILCSNLRRGTFESRSAASTGLGNSSCFQLRDLNRDGLVEVVADGVIFRNLGDLRFLAIDADRGDAFLLADLDQDGQVDRIDREADGSIVLRRGSLLQAAGPSETLPASGVGDHSPIVSDIDGDGDFDLVGASAAGGLEVWRSAARPSTPSFRVRLRGKKDSRQGLGAVVEVRGADHYERRLCLGEPMVFGLGSGEIPDIVRITWPNGVMQHAFMRARERGGAAGGSDPFDPIEVPQKEGLVGSCPFLYTHDGEGWEFISDILGTTPLGLPIDGQNFVPPDHDELVRIRGDQLRPVDGEYRLQITEELREVTYLDRAELWVVDHPQSIEVHPEERFCFPPFPPTKIHTIADARPIVRAVDQDGVDWTSQLFADDGDHAAPFLPLAPQFLGLVTPHYLEITLPDAVRTAESVRLMMNGWLLWTDASVNIAAARDPRWSFVPPILQVPDEDGVFRDAGPPLGFPAGKTKTMVVEVSSLLNRDDPRIRLFSSIRLYWDSIRVALDDGAEGDAQTTVTKLSASKADLYFRGFSKPFAALRENQPERFQFDQLREHAWDQHTGMLTRYGDVLPLLLDIDDRFVIFAAGDAIDLRFPADGIAPVAAGMARTFLLFVDGWAKDGDPNTYHAGRVDPLPFHGMSGYPYRSDERYPSDAEHARYRKEWNTRPGRRLLPILAPGSAPR